MDSSFHPVFYNGCNYIAMLGLKLIHGREELMGQENASNSYMCHQSKWYFGKPQCYYLKGFMSRLMALIYSEVGFSNMAFPKQKKSLE